MADPFIRQSIPDKSVLTILVSGDDHTFTAEGKLENLNGDEVTFNHQELRAGVQRELKSPGVYTGRIDINFAASSKARLQMEVRKPDNTKHVYDQTVSRPSGLDRTSILLVMKEKSSGAAVSIEADGLGLETTRSLRSYGVGVGGYGDITPDPVPPPAREEVQFSSYAPRAVRPGAWHTLLAYCHLPSALREIEKDSQAVLGAKKESFLKSSAESLSLIAREAEITFVPEVAGCRFNPPRASVLWLEDWHRADFRFRPAADQAPGRSLLGTVRCFVGPVLIAEIPFHTRVLAEGDADEAPDQRATASPYQSVFVSYSHQDSLLVDQLEQAYTVLGFKYLRDIRELRAGQEWNPALLRMIEEADLFQLCWSSKASLSPYVKQEWQHALAQRRKNFIRPMFWEQPQPTIPPELKDLHFARFQVALHPAPAG